MGNLLLIGTLVLTVLTLTMHGYLRATPDAALFLLLGILLLAFGGGSLLRAALFVVALYLFSKAIGADVGRVLVALSPLVILLVGLYVMLRGVTR